MLQCGDRQGSKGSEQCWLSAKCSALCHGQKIIFRPHYISLFTWVLSVIPFFSPILEMRKCYEKMLCIFVFFYNQGLTLEIQDKYELSTNQRATHTLHFHTANAAAAVESSYRYTVITPYRCMHRSIYTNTRS